jgi:hypothetical protein
MLKPWNSMVCYVSLAFEVFDTLVRAALGPILGARWRNLLITARRNKERNGISMKGDWR